MPEEETTDASQEEQDFSDDALDKAAEEFGESEEFTEHEEEVEAREEEEAEEESEEEKTELAAEQEEDVVPPEPSDNGERSKLGRKVKYIEDTVQSFQESFEEKMNRLEGLLVSSNRKQDTDESYLRDYEAGDDEEIIGTKAELKQFLTDYNKETESARQKNQAKYERDYVQTIKRLGSEETEEDHKDIYDEMMSHFNVRHSNNPLMDAEKNYLKATRSVLKKKVAAPVEKKNPLKGNKPKAPLGAGGNNETMPKKIKPMPKFDAAAQDFMRKSGITPERAAEILDGDAPANLGRR